MIRIQTIFLISKFLLWNNIIKSQNIFLNNNSFEDFSDCPEQPAEMELLNFWFDPTAASSDYFNACSGFEIVGVPKNFVGNSYAFDGSGYVGIVTYRNPEDEFREYISTKLKDKMIAGERYCVSFWVKLADSSNYSSNGIGIVFSNDTLNNSQNIFGNLQTSNFQYYQNNISKYEEWYQLKFLYIALGEESFLTIGNFLDYNSMNISKNKNSELYEFAYYYVDFVEINAGDCIDDIEIPNVFSPNNDGINDKIEVPDGYHFEIYNRWGIKVFESKKGDNSWDGKLENGLNVSDGVYFIIVYNTSKKIVRNSTLTLLR